VIPRRDIKSSWPRSVNPWSPSPSIKALIRAAMKLLSFFFGVLSLTSLVEGRLQRRKFHAKNQRGTRHSSVNPRDIAFHQRTARAPAYAKRESYNSTCVQCYAGSSAAISAPKENIWAPLANEEAASVTAFLFENSGYNLTLAENATDWDNTL
jgi:hypothetical protein